MKLMRVIKKNNLVIPCSLVLFGLLLVAFIVAMYRQYRRRKVIETFNTGAPRVYLIITTCLLDDNFELRKSQYQTGIRSMLEYIKNRPEIKTVIIENNTRSGNKTYLDDFGIPVIYTGNNDVEKCRGNRTHIGEIENMDIQHCLRELNIHDDDFIVKFTGRYIVESPCRFMDTLFEMMDSDPMKYDLITRYGNYADPKDFRMDEVVTGLIGMRAKYVKHITFNNRSIEHDWAAVAEDIPNEKVHIPKELGVQMCPGRVDGFFHI